ncbi:hypothetical protein FSC37_22770 [Piscinibacter aquaticus]|uniref:Fimbrial protein n=1 Tax=Piscinibacter aquaticus TaxID=392597 RepID=A0A5C6TN56_9BURK|nr:hypothetical protein FSC37_22770 [Piscinibacter aquaticus]
MKSMFKFCLMGSIAASAAAFISSANAAEASADVPINVNVVAPATCSVANSSPSVQIDVAGPAVTLQQFFQASGGQYSPAPQMFYVPNSEQTVTVECSGVASVPLTNVQVAPAPGETTTTGGSVLVLKDSAGNAFFQSGSGVAAHLVAVNGDTTKYHNFVKSGAESHRTLRSRPAR